MPRKRRFDRVRKTWIISSFGITCLTAMVSMAVPNGGQWVRSGHNDCPDGMVCADWEISGTPPWKGYCCIEEADLGSQDINDCQLGFRHSTSGP